MSIRAICWLGVALVLLGSSALVAQDRRAKVLEDREQLADDERWIYNDLAAARQRADEQRKPLLVVLRCIP
jgi:hypothetical protein